MIQYMVCLFSDHEIFAYKYIITFDYLHLTWLTNICGVCILRCCCSDLASKWIDIKKKKKKMGTHIIQGKKTRHLVGE